MIKMTKEEFTGQSKEHISKNVENIAEGRPILKAVVNEYISIIKETVSPTDLSFSLDVDIETISDGVHHQWYISMKIITEEELSEGQKMSLAEKINANVNEKLDKLREEYFNSKRINSYDNKIEMGIGTEEEFKNEKERIEKQMG